ncbi:MAG: FixJ family two-component response regulator [Enterobacterales bacterium]|jgi:FixJ family two-component response regulator
MKITAVCYSYRICMATLQDGLVRLSMKVISKFNQLHSREQSGMSESDKTRERTLLLVDDEDNIIRSLVRLLRCDGYNILTANSGAAGLEILSKNDVGVIISDQRMPQMSGVEFLSKVKKHYPDNVRMVLSGYTDLKSVTDAINEGAIYKFLTKPWEDDLIRGHVKDAFVHRELSRENERLARELKEVNDELIIANDKLQQKVLQKSRIVDINISSLKISQEILENMTVGVIGIANDGMITTANLKAHRLLAASRGLVGDYSQHIFPDALLQCYNDYTESAEEKNNFSVALDNGDKLDIKLCPLGRNSNSRGSIMVLNRLR